MTGVTYNYYYIPHTTITETIYLIEKNFLSPPYCHDQYTHRSSSIIHPPPYCHDQYTHRSITLNDISHRISIHNHSHTKNNIQKTIHHHQQQQQKQQWSPHPIISNNYHTTTTTTTTTLQTTPLPQQTTDSEKKSNTSYPIPSTITTKDGQQITVRYLEFDDLPDVVDMCVDEFGPSLSSKNDNDDDGPLGRSTITPLEQQQTLSDNSKQNDPLESLLKAYERWGFGVIVKYGLEQRIKRLKLSIPNTFSSSLTTTNIPLDHNVICLTLPNDDGAVAVIGLAEVSIQILDPTRTAPPYVYPLFLKKLLSLPSGGNLVAYVSNVLIKRDYRGRGYSKILMDYCERLAGLMGFEKVYLHVDADVESGKVAQGLYERLGYEMVVMEELESRTAFVGNGRVPMRGVYYVDGAALLYMKKDLGGL